MLNQNKSYFRNYLNTYFWQTISIVLGFLSMFIVTPYITSNPSTYGIYMVCMSITVFLSYADLGFLGAGQKFAAEYYAKGDRDSEVKIIGFSIPGYKKTVSKRFRLLTVNIRKK